MNGPYRILKMGLDYTNNITKKKLEKILKDINIQVVEAKNVINLGQLLRIVLDIKRYIFKPIKFVQLVQLELVH
jgi:hypothetical protein